MGHYWVLFYGRLAFMNLPYLESGKIISIYVIDRIFVKNTLRMFICSYPFEGVLLCSMYVGPSNFWLFKSKM